jgi:hypothetical protein
LDPYYYLAEKFSPSSGLQDEPQKKTPIPRSRLRAPEFAVWQDMPRSGFMSSVIRTIEFPATVQEKWPPGEKPDGH